MTDTPTPRANPPIHIGELSNVPAPQSPIASQWAQDVTNRIVHHFADTATRAAAWPAPLVGSLSTRGDPNVLEYFDGARWLPVIGAHLAPSYGAIQGGQSHPGEQHMIAEYTIPYATDARFTHSVLLNGDAAWAGKISLRFDTGQVIFDVCVGSWAAIPMTGHLVDIPVGGLGAGQKIQVWFIHSASPGGNVAFYTDPSNNRGSALIGARFGSPTTSTVQPADVGEDVVA